jgi:2-polyprenyl-3-methyl-5-hydroxy-6-metoxy-1,4-benzoquinol methylase
LANPLNQCAACDHIQVAVAPDTDRLRDYYSGNHSRQRAAHLDKAYRQIAARRASAQLDCYRDHTSGTVQLPDVGCGYGHLVSEAARRQITSARLEYDQSAIQHGTDRQLNIRAVASEQDIANEIAALRSGIVVMSHVLNRYGVRHVDGIWLRVLARGSRCGF